MKQISSCAVNTTLLNVTMFQYIYWLQKIIANLTLLLCMFTGSKCCGYIHNMDNHCNTNQPDYCADL